MLHSPAILFVVVALLGGQEARPHAGTYELRAQVLDVFDAECVLLSIGSQHGVRKGMKGALLRSSPAGQVTLAATDAEFVEVGATHSIVRVPTRWPGFDVRCRLQANDSIVWHSLERRPVPQLPYAPVHLQRGGAIVDLTGPAGAKLWPHKE